MKSRVEIKAQARASFMKQQGMCILGFVVYSVLTSVLSGATFGVATLFLLPPLTVGYAYFNMRVYRGDPVEISDLLSTGFRDYMKNLVGMLWMYLFTFLWSLLFIIPGIVKALAYSMTPYILADRDDVEAQEALKISMDMTNGYKAEIFVMALSFIGWWLLTALTFGILAFFFTGPYTAASFAGLYEELKKEPLEENEPETVTA